MASSRLFKFLHSDSKAKRFNYKPRYYNQNKEKLEKKSKLFAQEKAELSSEEGRERLNFRSKEESKWIREHTSRASKASSWRFAIIALALVVFIILYFKKLGISIFGA